MGGTTRALKIATIAMGVLILLGTGVLIVTIVRRVATGSADTSLGAGVPVVPGKPFASVLDEPPGTGIVGIAPLRDRLAVQLRGGGTDRVLLIDPASGAVVGRIALAR
jgi:hypothetical protein